jgi:hypothetical protein
MEGGLWAWEAL